MTSVTIPERILIKEGVETAQFTLIFVGNGSRAYKTMGPAPELHKQLQ